MQLYCSCQVQRKLEILCNAVGTPRVENGLRYSASVITAVDRARRFRVGSGVSIWRHRFSRGCAALEDGSAQPLLSSSVELCSDRLSCVEG